MEDEARNRGRDAATGKFLPGNPGRPPGTRCRATRAAEALLDGAVDRLTRKAIDMALAGDPTAMRLCLERVLAPRKDRPVRFELPPLRLAADAPAALGVIAEGAAAGELTPGEAAVRRREAHRVRQLAEVATSEAPNSLREALAAHGVDVVADLAKRPADWRTPDALRARILTTLAQYGWPRLAAIEVAARKIIAS